jgi:hypothetical protein
MNARKSLIAGLLALMIGCGALIAHATPTSQSFADLGLSPTLVRLFACTSLCSRVGLNAENACEEDVRSGGDATADDLALCLLEGIRAEHACLEKYSCLE